MNPNNNMQLIAPRKTSRLQNRSPSSTTTLSDMPSDVVIKILKHLGVCSAKDVFKCKTLNKDFNKKCDSKDIYEHLEVDTFFSFRFAMFGRHDDAKKTILNRCRKEDNPNLMFREAMVQYFVFGEESGKTSLEKASELGQSDATFVVGMLKMAEGGHHNKQAALRMLNEGNKKCGRKWRIGAKLEKVQRILSRGRVKPPTFHGCYLTCKTHQDEKILSRASITYRDRWLNDCEVCLWEAAYMGFVRIFGKEWFW